MKDSARLPASVPASTSARSRSPADTCTSPNCRMTGVLSLHANTSQSHHAKQAQKTSLFNIDKMPRTAWQVSSCDARQPAALMTAHLLHNPLTLRPLASSRRAGNHDSQRLLCAADMLRCPGVIGVHSNLDGERDVNWCHDAPCQLQTGSPKPGRGRTDAAALHLSALLRSWALVGGRQTVLGLCC